MHLQREWRSARQWWFYWYMHFALFPLPRLQPCQWRHTQTGPTVEVSVKKKEGKIKNKKKQN